MQDTTAQYYLKCRYVQLNSTANEGRPVLRLILACLFYSGIKKISHTIVKRAKSQ